VEFSNKILIKGLKVRIMAPEDVEETAGPKGELYQKREPVLEKDKLGSLPWAAMAGLLFVSFYRPTPSVLSPTPPNALGRLHLWGWLL
jgi:hypothetical protein